MWWKVVRDRVWKFGCLRVGSESRDDVRHPEVLVLRRKRESLASRGMTKGLGWQCGLRTTICLLFGLRIFLGGKVYQLLENFVGYCGELAAVYENGGRAVDVEGLA